MKSLMKKGKRIVMTALIEGEVSEEVIMKLKRMAWKKSVSGCVFWSRATIQPNTIMVAYEVYIVDCLTFKQKLRHYLRKAFATIARKVDVGSKVVIIPINR